MAKKKVKKKTTKRRRIPIIKAVRVKEITVKYGGVVRTGSYENKRLSFEFTADCPRHADPDIVCDYLEALAANQFYQAQIKALETLPEEMRDKVVDVHNMSPVQAAKTISDFFRNFGANKPLTAEQKKKRIEELGKELKGLSTNLAKENKRLQKKKNIESEDLVTRSETITRQRAIKNELRELRRS